MRNLSKEQEVRKGIAKVIDAKSNLEFCELNLLSDQGWDKAMDGCDYVLHVASPFVIAVPKDENESWERQRGSWCCVYEGLKNTRAYIYN